MTRLLLVCVAGCGWSASPEAPPAPPPPQPAVFVEVLPVDGPLREQLAKHVATAKAEGRKPFLQVYAEWCGPCKELRSHMDDPLMQDAFLDTYIVQAKHTPWNQQILLALPSGIENVAVPSFWAIDDEGRLGRLIDGHAWGPNTPEEMSGPLSHFFRE